MLLPLWMNNSLGGVAVTLPNVSGLTQIAAIAALNAAGFVSIVISLVYSVPAPVGSIAGQFPVAGTSYPTTGVIFLFESLGSSADQVKVH